MNSQNLVGYVERETQLTEAFRFLAIAVSQKTADDKLGYIFSHLCPSSPYLRSKIYLHSSLQSEMGMPWLYSQLESWSHFQTRRHVATVSMGMS